MRTGWLAGLAMALGLATAAPGAPAPWRVATGEHFTIYSQESASSLRRFAERLELFDAALRHLFPVKSDDRPPTGRLTIYALNGAAAVQKVMGGHDTFVYGVYRPSITGSLALTARENNGNGYDLNTQIVLLHEYTHHFMLANFPGAYPTWFVEGFAEFASTAKFMDNGDVGIGAPAMHRAYGLVMMDQQLALNRMLSDNLAKLTPEERESLYGRGWLLTHMLFFEKSRDGQLNKYINSINAGTSYPKAAEEAFGSPRKLGVDLENYLRRGTMSYLQLKREGLKPSPVTIADATPAESAIIPVRVESKYGVDRAEAAKLVPLARAAASPYPAEPVAQCMLAEAEDDATNYAEADAAADRLLAADPKSYCGLRYKGEIAMHRAMSRKAPGDDKEWKTARDWFAKANRADIENPLPMYLYYETFRAARAKPSANAVDALMGAAQRAPQDEGARIAATLELLRMHRDAEARTMLGPVANSAHGNAGGFLGDIYRRIGEEPSEQLADRLAAGPQAAAKTGTATAAGS